MESKPSASLQDKVRFHRSPCQISAPDCVALLAGLAIDFSTARLRFCQYTEDASPARKPESNAGELSVESARRIAMAALSQYLEEYKVPPQCLFHLIPARIYWFLRLYDAEWLDGHLRRVKVIPSREIDRKLLMRIANDNSLPVRPRRIAIEHSPSGTRAALRDNRWYRALVETLSQTHQDEIAIRRKDIRKQRISVVEAALNRILEEEGKPEWITARKLGSLTGLSRFQVAETIKTTPTLRAQVSRANAMKNRRQVLWATRKLHQNGLKISHLSVGRTAGLPTSQKNLELMKWAERVVRAEIQTRRR
jgi:hypothetical protein